MTTSLRAESRCVLRPAECWEKLRDLSLARHYVPGVEEIEFLTEQRQGVGTSRIARMKVGGLHETVIEWNDGEGFLLRLHRGENPPRPMKEATFRYAIEPDGVSTHIVLSMTYAFGMGPLGPLLESLARRPIQGNLDKIATRLPRFWETGNAET